MSTPRLAVIVALLVTMALAGCANTSPAPSPAASQAGELINSTSIANPLSPQGIMTLSKRLATHRPALFSITQNKYSYFADESLAAEYEVATGILRVSSLAPGQTDLVCVYSPQGVLYLDPKTHPDGKVFIAGCNQLVMNLNDDLSR